MSEEQVEHEGGTALTAAETREFTFHGDTLLVALVDGVPYVALRPIVEGLRIEWAPQYQRLQRDDVLNEERRLVVMTSADGKSRKMVALPLEFLPGWLFGITGSRFKDPTIAQKLRLYRRECFRVLWREFGGLPQPGAVSSEPAVPVIPTTTVALTQVRDIGLALVQMAEEQMQMAEHMDALSVRVDDAHNRLDRAAEVVKDFQRRLKTVERRMLPYECISAEQATEVRLAVQRLGELLTSKAAKDRKPGEKLVNYYSSIFQEIYNRTGAPRYELIRVEDYLAVMRFLEDWWKSVSQGRDIEEAP
jgi:hypothetical protein